MPAGLFCDVIMKQKEDFFSQKAYVSLFFPRSFVAYERAANG